MVNPNSENAMGGLSELSQLEMRVLRAAFNPRADGSLEPTEFQAALSATKTLAVKGYLMRATSGAVGAGYEITAAGVAAMGDTAPSFDLEKLKALRARARPGPWATSAPATADDEYEAALLNAAPALFSRIEELEAKLAARGEPLVPTLNGQPLANDKWGDPETIGGIKRADLEASIRSAEGSTPDEIG